MINIKPGGGKREEEAQIHHLILPRRATHSPDDLFDQNVHFAGIKKASSLPLLYGDTFVASSGACFWMLRSLRGVSVVHPVSAALFHSVILTAGEQAP